MTKPTDYLAAARAALQACTPEERTKLFAEFNHTVVDEVKALARTSPGAAAGALVGGVLGLLMDAPSKLTLRPVRPEPPRGPLNVEDLTKSRKPAPTILQPIDSCDGSAKYAYDPSKDDREEGKAEDPTDAAPASQREEGGVREGASGTPDRAHRCVASRGRRRGQGGEEDRHLAAAGGVAHRRDGAAGLRRRAAPKTS